MEYFEVLSGIDLLSHGMPTNVILRFYIKRYLAKVVLRIALHFQRLKCLCSDLIHLNSNHKDMTIVHSFYVCSGRTISVFICEVTPR